MPDDFHVLTLEQVSALASYEKNEVFWEFSPDKPTTVVEVSQRLKKSRPTVHHHVNTLVNVGLLKAAATQQKGARTETLYIWPFPTFRHQGAEATHEYRKQSARIFAATARRMTQEVNLLMQKAPNHPELLRKTIFRHTHLTLSDEHFEKLRQILLEADQELNSLDEQEHATRYHVVLFANPTLDSLPED